MRHARSTLDYISLVNDLDRLPSFLVEAGSFGDEQNLTTWMYVPIELRTGIIGSYSNAGIEVECDPEEFTVGFRWLLAVDDEPWTLTDYCFSWMRSLARHGSGTPLNPLRVEYVQ